MNFNSHILANSILIALLVVSHMYQWAILSAIIVGFLWFLAIIGIATLPFLKTLTPILENMSIPYYPNKKAIDLVIDLLIITILLYTGYFYLTIAYLAVIIASQHALAIAKQQFYKTA